MKNNIVLWVVLVIVVGAVAFWGGMQYGRNASAGSSFRQFSDRNMLGQTGMRTGSGQFSSRMRGGGQVAGEIISSDDSSVTVKLTDGSSKIVLLSDKTTINKAEQASKIDLTQGTRVVVFGTTNSDGSITAQMIQLNPMFRGMTQPTGKP